MISVVMLCTQYSLQKYIQEQGKFHSNDIRMYGHTYVQMYVYMDGSIYRWTYVQTDKCMYNALPKVIVNLADLGTPVKHA